MHGSASRYWRDWTTEEIAGLDAERLVVVQPLAATEQHGPHLPLDVDAAICRAIVARSCDLLAPTVPVLVLPSLDIGVSPEHADFEGTLSLAPETLIAVLTEIAGGVAALGVRKIAFINTHGGQPQILDIVAQRLRARHEMLAVALNAYRYFGGERFFDADELAHGIHAGAVETSLMMAIDPDSVRLDRLRPHPSLTQEQAAAGGLLRPFGRTVSYGWQTQDLSPSGAVGDPTAANAEAGEAMLERAAETVAGILAELADTPVEILLPGLK